MDAKKREISLEVASDELAERRTRWQRPDPYALHGTLAKYAKLVSSASEAAVTDKYL